MLQQASDKLVALVAELQRVSRVGKHWFALGVGEAQVKVQTTAWRVGKGFGHAAEHRAMPLGHCVCRYLEQHEAVCRRQRLVKLVIDFILAAGIFMVHLL